MPVDFYTCAFVRENGKRCLLRRENGKTGCWRHWQQTEQIPVAPLVPVTRTELTVAAINLHPTVYFPSSRVKEGETPPMLPEDYGIDNQRALINHLVSDVSQQEELDEWFSTAATKKWLLQLMIVTTGCECFQYLCSNHSQPMAMIQTYTNDDTKVDNEDDDMDVYGDYDEENNSSDIETDQQDHIRQRYDHLIYLSHKNLDSLRVHAKITLLSEGDLIAEVMRQLTSDDQQPGYRRICLVIRTEDLIAPLVSELVKNDNELLKRLSAVEAFIIFTPKPFIIPNIVNKQVQLDKCLHHQAIATIDTELAKLTVPQHLSAIIASYI